ncbi:MAG TPA: transcription termination factor Rho [Lachnospiraceae bacterium]|nr:transcription termination factor Rho [Lachnospiraceae bacterium]
MTKEEYVTLAVAQLREHARKLGIKGVSSLRKNELIDALLHAQESPSPDGDHHPARKDAGQGSEPPADSPSEARSEALTEARSDASAEDRSDSPSEDHSEALTEDASVISQGEGSGIPAEEKTVTGMQAAKQSPEEGSGDIRPGADRTMQSQGEEMPGKTRQERRPLPQRQDSHARVIVRRGPGSGQGAQGRSIPGQAAQGRMVPGQPVPGRMAPGQAAQGRAVPGQAKVIRPSAPMTRGEMHQSNPQPKAEPVESLQDRMDQDRPPMELKQLDSGNEVSGVLEVMADGYGFIRSNNYLPGEDDVYVSPSQIRKFGLKTGDIVCGNTRVHAQQEKFSALLFVKLINGCTPSEAAKRYDFENMTPVFPNERLRMERTGREVAMRIVDLLAPIGKGQRGLIVSPPKAGKTTLLKDIARSILRNNPEMHIIIMLIDERPEEVTDIREAIVGENVEVLDSTFDETPEHHKRVAEMGIERARRLVEHCRDVVILLDSITRLARAYNLIVPPSGRTLSGGLDPAALHPPKRFFGAARNMREGGSLTILATALVDTGSKMDDVVYEEFKGTGNMELILDRKLSERRVFPAIDIQKSGTRREDLLLTPDEGEASYVMRKAMNGMKGEDAVERILDMFARTRNNEELIQRVKHSHVV